MAISLKPFCSNLLMMSATNPRWTASGLIMMKVLSVAMMFANSLWKRESSVAIIRPRREFKGKETGNDTRFTYFESPNGIISEWHVNECDSVVRDLSPLFISIGLFSFLIVRIHIFISCAIFTSDVNSRVDLDTIARILERRTTRAEFRGSNKIISWKKNEFRCIHPKISSSWEPQERKSSWINSVIQ